MDFTSDLNIEQLQTLPSPQDFLTVLPASKADREFVANTRRQIKDILLGRDKRPIIIVGPCSIHHIPSAMEYALKLKQLAEQVSEEMLIVMRAHFEKPRTLLGWKGLLYDPSLDGSHQLLSGLQKTREFLLQMAEMQIPAATEFLDLSTPLYFADLISWAQIGSRTSASQIHRQFASSMPMPIGFKNSTDGNVKVAAEGAAVASSGHIYPAYTISGKLATIKSLGNPACHIVLRGGTSGQNYSPQAIQEACAMAGKYEITPRLIVDCSHDNVQGQYEKQSEVFESVIDQLTGYGIAGVILESYLQAGKQPYLSDPTKILPHVSLTDGCIDWPTTERLIIKLFNQLSQAKSTV